MADAMAAMGQSPAAAPGKAARPTVYAAGGGRKFAFSFVFLLLLPFFISLPPMLFWRISQGHWQGTFGLAVLAVAFAFIMFLIVIELMHSLMARIELGDKAVKLTLPAGRGPTPMVRYKTREILYTDIKAIETRREIYGGSVAPVLLKGARLILKDDTPVKLGYVSEADSDPSFPYPDIAHQIAERRHPGDRPRQRAPLRAEEIPWSQEDLAHRAGRDGRGSADRGAQREPPALGDAADPAAGRPRRRRHRARHHLSAEQRPAAGAEKLQEPDHAPGRAGSAQAPLIGALGRC
jgi:hypothetical protein